jgi:glycosyltransferase involved in cell wall biosynthesis
VSVIMATRDRAPLLARAILSILAQTYTGWELIVVDDASTDRTAETVAAFADPRIRYRRNERPLGAAGARNAGIGAAGRTSYLAFLDDDDEWAPRKLELQMEAFRAGPADLVAVGCDRVEYDPNPVVTRSENRGYIFEHLLARRSAGYGGQQLLVRRQPGRFDLLFDESLPCLEDADYALRLARLGALDFVPEILVSIHRDHGGEHVWNAAGMVGGYDRMSEKYATELAARPVVRSYYRFCAARGLAALGRVAACRGRLRLALADAPRSWRLRFWHAASFLGRAGLAVARRLAPIGPPPVEVRPGPPFLA